jgi:hypothetical protein
VQAENEPRTGFSHGGGRARGLAGAGIRRA